LIKGTTELSEYDWHFDSILLGEHENKDKIGENPLSEEHDKIWEYSEISLTNGFLPMLGLKVGAPFSKQEEDISEYYANIKKLFKHCISTIHDYLNSFLYLGPLRPSPKRLYLLDDSQQSHWEFQELDAFIRFLKGQLTDNEREEINSWLKKLELAESMKPIPLLRKEESSDVASKVELDEGKTGHHSINLIDIGFGASQVLPIIIQSLLAKPGSFVIIEQPELHLHPRAQSVIGDMFVMMARRGVNFLLETHSEHLLLRFRRWITERTVGKRVLSSDTNYLEWEDLIPYFIDRQNGCSSVTRIGIDAYGEFVNIPDGFDDFFSDDLSESLELTKLKLTSWE